MDAENAKMENAYVNLAGPEKIAAIKPAKMVAVIMEFAIPIVSLVNVMQDF